jgi:hypothetical protein
MRSRSAAAAKVMAEMKKRPSGEPPGRFHCTLYFTEGYR